jgi:hypothetical protein
MLLGAGAKTPGCPFRVQPVATTAALPAFTSVMTHFPSLALHVTVFPVTWAVAFVIWT